MFILCECFDRMLNTLKMDGSTVLIMLLISSSVSSATVAESRENFEFPAASSAESFTEVQETKSIVFSSQSSLAKNNIKEGMSIGRANEDGFMGHSSSPESPTFVSKRNILNREERNLANTQREKKHTNLKQSGVETGGRMNLNHRSNSNQYITRRFTRTKRTLGRFWSKPSPSWFSGGSRPRFGTGGFHRASSMTGNNRGTDNNWVHFIPELFPNLTPRYGMPTPPSAKTTAFAPPPTTSSPPLFTFASGLTVDPGLHVGYTFSDGRPLTLEPDAETLSPLL